MTHFNLVDSLKFIDVYPIIRRVYAIFKEYPWPEDWTKLDKICNDFANIASDPELLEAFPNMLLLKGRVSRRDAIRTIAAIVDNKLCRRAKQRDTKLFADIREINSKMDKIIVIRDSVIRVLKIANKPDMKITPGQMHCYIDKWVDDGISLLTTTSAKEFALQLLSGFRIFFDRFKKDDKCPPLNSNEKITEDDMKNLELIGLKGASNIIIKNSNSK